MLTFKSLQKYIKGSLKNVKTWFKTFTSVQNDIKGSSKLELKFSNYNFQKFKVGCVNK